MVTVKRAADSFCAQPMNRTVICRIGFCRIGLRR